jgi:hypothetical protein
MVGIVVEVLWPWISWERLQAQRACPLRGLAAEENTKRELLFSSAAKALS